MFHEGNNIKIDPEAFKQYMFQNTNFMYPINSIYSPNTFNSEKISIICKKHGKNNLTRVEHFLIDCVQCEAENSTNALNLNYNFEQSPVIFTSQKSENQYCVHVNYIYCNKCLNCITNQKYIEIAKLKYGNSFDYLNTKYEHINKEIIIKCVKHGQFEIFPDLHLTCSNGGCVECNNINLYEKNKLSTDEITDIHYSLNYNNADYYQKCQNIESIIILCPFHGNFKIKQSECLRDLNGCADCNKTEENIKLTTLFNSIIPPAKSEISPCSHKLKEQEIVNLLMKEFPNKFIHNRSVGSDFTGNHLFPDLRYECELFHLIIEIDENGHSGYGSQKEIIRMHNIIDKLRKPCVFLRYNPDNPKSDKQELLKLVKYYMKYDYPINRENSEEKNNLYKKLKIDEQTGLYVKYLFYT